jgi:hypothetical protein
MVMSQDQHAVENDSINIGNKSFERVESSNIWEKS